MKKIAILLLILFCIAQSQAQNNVVKGTGKLYTSGVPTPAININKDSEFACDTTNNSKEYGYDRDAETWIHLGWTIQELGANGVPAYTPHDKQGYFVVNNGDSLYHFRSATWNLVSGGGGGSDGNGIYDGAGIVPNNTYAKIGTNGLNTNVFALGYANDYTDPFATPITARGYFLDANGFVSLINSDSTVLASAYVTLDRSNINIVADGATNQSIIQLDTTFISMQNGGALIQLIGDDNQLSSDSLYIGISGGYIEINGSKGTNGQVIKSNGYSFDWANESDASSTNELQTIDTFTRSNDTLFASLSSDGQAAKFYVIQDNSKSNEGSLVIGGTASTVTLTTNTIGSPVQTWVGSGNINVKDSSGYSVIYSAYGAAQDTTYFHHQNGNSYGATWVGGTNDNFGVNLEIQDTATLLIATDQTATFRKITGTNNAIVDQLVLDIQSHNATQGNFGNSILFTNELSNGTTGTNMARLGSYWSNPISGTHEGVFTFQLGDAGGALTEVMKLDRTSSTGVLTIGTSAPIIIRPDYIEISQVSAPSTPATNYGRIYKFTDDSLYFINEAGNNINLCRGTSGSAVTTNVLSLSGNTMTSNVEGISDTSLVIGTVLGSLAGNSITINVNNVTDTVLVIGGVSNTSSTNSLSTTVNGITGSTVNIINSNVLSYGTVSGIVTSTINGVTDTTLITPSSDGNGIYTGDGTVPDETYATSGTSVANPGSFGIGFFPSFPDLALNGRDRGLFFDKDVAAVYIIGGDTATSNVLTYVKAGAENVGLFVSDTADYSISSDLDIYKDYIDMIVSNSTIQSRFRLDYDSTRLITDKIFIETDSIRLKLAGSFGTSGQFVKVGANGLLEFGTGGGSFTTEDAQDAIGAMINGSLTYVDATPLFHIADRDWGPFTSSSNGLVFGMDVGSIETSHILDSTILEVDLASNSVGSNAIKGGAVDASELASTAVTPGSYTNTNLTVDADGRITAASNGSAGTGDILNGGNTTGAPIRIGTNDAFGLQLETNGAGRIYIDSIGLVGIGTAAPLVKLHIGDTSINNSVDCQVLLSRSVKGTVSGNGHGFSESSQINRAGSIGYNSYDARVNFIGTYNYDHYAAFQALPVYGSTGTLDDYYGVFSGMSVSASSTITNSHSFYALNPTGSGTITNAYGLYIENITKGSTTNYSIYTGTAQSSFNGNVGFGTAAPSSKISIGTPTAAIVTAAGAEGILYSSTSGVCLAAERTSASSTSGGGSMLLIANDGAALASGDRLGGFTFGGSSSASSIRNAAEVGGYADAAWTDGSSYPTSIQFKTTPIGGTSRVERLRMTNDGSMWQNSGSFSAIPDAIADNKVLRKAITGTAASELFIDGSALRAILPATNTGWEVSIDLIAICTAAGNGTTTAGEGFAAKRYAAISRIGSTTALIGSVETLGTDKSGATMSTSVTTITADDTNEALKITFTPPSTAGSTTTFRVVATYKIVQVQY